MSMMENKRAIQTGVNAVEFVLRQRIYKDDWPAARERARNIGQMLLDTDLTVQELVEGVDKALKPTLAHGGVRSPGARRRIAALVVGTWISNTMGET